ncbi:MAG TPA: DoxX family protein [Acidimicrobiia bacterium]|jgi:putative oxidoreductase|nr:DoxX family protein [Acidimicrobiia bacterium]
MRLAFAAGALPSGAAPLLLRLVVGPMLAYHGYRKLDAGVGRFVATVHRYGFPLPEVLARATIVIELVGGVCLTIGLLTRVWSGFVTLQMLLIVAKVKWHVGLFGPPGKGGGFELDLLYAVVAAALLIAGPGLFAVDHAIGLEVALSPDPEPRRRDDPIRAGT